jgi:hypothetical protein
MRPQIIDQYNYCSTTNNKTKVYHKEKYSEEEMNKTREIKKNILDFIRIVIDKPDYHNRLLESDNIHERVCYDTFEGIHYNDTYGYISKGNYDRDIVDVYFYGNTHEEAFKTAAYEIVMDLSHNYELWHREELTKDFYDRFIEGVYDEENHHCPFSFAEHSLQLLRKYYSDNIPEDIIKEFEDYIKSVEKMDVIFSYETNRFEKRELGKILNRKKGA